MSDKAIETEWAEALKRAAELDDEDFRYALCDGFLSRAVMRLTPNNEGLGRLATYWFAPNRRDDDCAAEAKRILSGRYLESHTRRIVEIIARRGTEDIYDNPEHVGYVCAYAAYYVGLFNVAGAMSGTDITERVADIACGNEKRLQIMDVQEALALLAHAKGEAE